MHVDACEYFLSEGTRIFSNGKDEFRIRKGVWNFNEATINLKGQNDSIKTAVASMLQQLDSYGSLKIPECFCSHTLNDTECKAVIELFTSIYIRKFLRRSDSIDYTAILSQIMGGAAITIPLDLNNENSTALFFSDGSYSKKIALSIAEESDFNLTVIDEKLYSKLEKIELTTCTNAMKTKKQVAEIASIVAPYSCVIGCMENPSLIFLRNLNRILIHLQKPLVLGMLDGPFLSVLAIKPPETGCFECFEHRLLARMEDLAAYRKFVVATGNKKSDKRNVRVNPLVHLVVSSVMLEGMMLAMSGKSRVSARVISIYLPILEIQTQDLLRIPYCPACGFTARAQSEELYTSAKGIVDAMLTTIEISSTKVGD